MIKEKAKLIYESLSVNKWPHVKRVLTFADIISNKLNLSDSEKKIISISAILHDIGYKKLFEIGGEDIHEKYSSEMIEEFLGDKYSEEMKNEIKKTILTHGSFDQCETLFQKILFDADKLDKTTFGEIIRKTIILHGKYKMNDLEIFEEFKERIESRKFHLDISKKIAKENKSDLLKIFSKYSEFLEVVEEKENEFNF